MSDKEVNTFVEKWTLALNVTDNIRIDDIPPAEKGLRKALVIIKDLQAEQWISADQEPEIYDQFEVYATLNGEWKIKDATFSFEFERFIFDGCQEWIPMFYRKVELPK